MVSSKPFDYHRLQPDHIRLLCLLPPDPYYKGDPNKRPIECELKHISLHEANGYDALSYVWGPPDRDATIHIKAGGRQPASTILPVTRSLFIALLYLRYAKEKRLLWVDQICIDQNCTPEKNDQVGRMGEIYSKANCAVVWLGRGGKDSKLLNEMYLELSKLPPRPEASGGVRMLDPQALAQAVGTSFTDERKNDKIRRNREVLQRLLARPWFCRVWVYQEAVVAPKVEVLWGSISVPLDFVTGLIISVYGIAKNDEDGRWHKQIKSVSGFSPLRTIYHDRQAHKEGKLNLLNVLWHARKHLSASNPRDYVFAFLAVNRHPISTSGQGSEIVPLLQDKITPKYDDSVEGVYTDFARSAVHCSSSLEILQYVVPTKSSGKPLSLLPTWAPNWSDPGFICGSPIFVPGVPNHLSACRGKWYIRESMGSNQTELPVQVHIVSHIGAVMKHSFKHAYFCPTLKKAFRLDKLQTLLKYEASRVIEKNTEKNMPDWVSSDTRKTLLRTILANGSFTTDHELGYPIEELLSVYDNELGDESTDGADEATKLRQYLRQSGEVACGKRVFLTRDLDIGLGFSTIGAGDVVCILYGSQFPCILRKSEGFHNRYTLVGLCFLDGWMDGERNPRNWDWWTKDPEEFILI